MRKISVFDTTISDYNLGNQIIMEGVYEHLNEMFPKDFFFKLPYMEITNHTIAYLKRSDLKFFGGTNALSGQMGRYKQWDLTIAKALRMSDVTLMGIGWWQYQGSVSLYTQFLLKQVLSKKYVHSVRDSHTMQKLQEIGITNVINTGCPTLWNITPEHCTSVPAGKAKDVVLTFTDYHKNPTRDAHILKTLSKLYDKIYYWIQGEGDLEFINQLRTNENIILVDPNLSSFDAVLNDNTIDYVGTRLHAGIRALQKKRRSLIIGIDNRALEMKKDFNLPVLHHDEIENLESIISAPQPVNIQMPFEKIQQWKNQFRNEVS